MAMLRSKFSQDHCFTVVKGIHTNFKIIILLQDLIFYVNGDQRDKHYRAFHRFGQAKFPGFGLILGTSQFSVLPQLPPHFKRGQNQLENKQLALLI